jgi:hypothetical protein
MRTCVRWVGSRPARASAPRRSSRQGDLIAADRAGWLRTTQGPPRDRSPVRTVTADAKILLLCEGRRGDSHLGRDAGAGSSLAVVRHDDGSHSQRPPRSARRRRGAPRHRERGARAPARPSARHTGQPAHGGLREGPQGARRVDQDGQEGPDRLQPVVRQPRQLLRRFRGRARPDQGGASGPPEGGRRDAARDGPRGRPGRAARDLRPRPRRRRG